MLYIYMLYIYIYISYMLYVYIYGQRHYTGDTPKWKCKWKKLALNHGDPWGILGVYTEFSAKPKRTNSW